MKTTAFGWSLAFPVTLMSSRSITQHLSVLIASSIIRAIFATLIVEPVSAQLFSPGIDSVPTSRVPAQFTPAQNYRARGPVDVTRLRQPQQEQYTLAADDILGVFVEGVLGELGENPPVHFPPPGSDLKPGLGYPVPVRADGTLALPLIDPLPVAGLTLPQAEALIKRAYAQGDQPFVAASSARILVSLLAKRTYRVYVIREDDPGSSARSINQQRGATRRSDRSGRGTVLQMEAGQNDLLNALIETGGFPGVNAKDEIRVERERQQQVPDEAAFQSGTTQFNSAANGTPGSSTSGFSEFPRSGAANIHRQNFSGRRVDNRADSVASRSMSARPMVSGAMASESMNASPMNTGSHTRSTESHFYRSNQGGFTGQFRQGTSTPRAELRDGDTIYVDAKPTEVYYTGGLLGGGEFPLPRDRKLDVFEAVSIAGGPVGAAQGAGQGGPGGIPSLPPTELIVLRQQQQGPQFGNGQIAIAVDMNRVLNNPAERIPVAPGDTLILRYKRAEALGNFGIGVFNTYGLRQLIR